VTTVIAGEGGTPVDAAEIPGYFQKLETQGIAINFGTYYASHPGAHEGDGRQGGRPTPAQIALMGRSRDRHARRRVRHHQRADLPAQQLPDDEDLVALAKVAGRCNGFYATHMRDESSKLIPAIEEAIEIGEKGGVKVEIFHLKAAYAPQWGKLMPKAVAD
jgi:N-acyl-D-amino-acid deacylase